jgi:hypothetical protein
MTSSTVATAPTPKQIDALIVKYAGLQQETIAAGAASRKASDAADVVKAELTLMVESFGLAHTDKSKRLVGLHNTATTTTGTRVSVDDAAVDGLREYLDKTELPELAGRFFVARTTYSLVQGPAEVLKTLTLGKRVRTQISSLLGLCFQVKTNAPSLKIVVVDPELP